jgi:hypothetical protein
MTYLVEIENKALQGIKKITKSGSRIAIKKLESMAASRHTCSVDTP